MAGRLVALPAGKTVHGRPCATTALIRATVTNYPLADNDQRLVATELWLIDRLPDGSEVPRSEALTIRSLPNHPGRFFFDSIVEGSDALDLYGMVIARVDGNDLRLTLETRARRKQLLGDNVGPFGKRNLSIRAHARQIR